MKAVFAVLTIVCSAAVLWAASPLQINYQGMLTSSLGTPLDTVVSITFKLYDAATNGNQLWSETQNPCTVRAGLFHVPLGSVTPLTDMFNEPEIWLGIAVGNNTEMVPRSRMISVPYAYRVGTVDGASGGAISGNLQADTLKPIEGVLFGNGSFQSSASDTTGLASRTWVQSMGYLRGNNNAVSATGFIGGGDYHRARGDYAVIGGGGSALASDSNTASATGATIGGGKGNRAAGNYATISGGSSNQAFSQSSCIGGGQTNIAAGISSAIAGGGSNSAGGQYAAVAGGNMNSAIGNYSSVPGGANNVASGRFSLAAGRRAKAMNDGAFVWADSTNADFSSTTPNQFLIRAGGGVGIGLNNPAEQLEVAGDVKGDTFRVDAGIRFPDGSIQTAAAIPSGQQYSDTSSWDATRSWVQGKNYLVGADSLSLSNRINIKADSADNATRSWVQGQNYLVSTDTLSLSDRINAKGDSADNATRTWVQDRNYLVGGDTLSLSSRVNAKADSADNATRSWVTAQEYTANAQTYPDTSMWDATRSWVQSKNYLTGGDTLSLSSRVNARADSADNATRTWVQSKNYLTGGDTLSMSSRVDAKADSADNATRIWVTSQGYTAHAQIYPDTNTWDATRTWVLSPACVTQIVQLLNNMPDADGDGHTKYSLGGDDCDDLDPSVYAGAPEICDGKDNDCDRVIDEGVLGTLFRDADADGYGDSANTIFSCSAVSGYVSNDDDCDDSNPARHPGATEICDNIDGNCDGVGDDYLMQNYYRDLDSDGYGNSTIILRACSQPTGYVSQGGDCNDSNPAINPAAVEICDGVDNDCDGQTDEGGSPRAWYYDGDNDGYGDANGTPTMACTSPGQYYVLNNADCDDTNGNIHPGAIENCYNSVDDDCDNVVDEATIWYQDADMDGYGCPTIIATQCNKPYGTSANHDDCNDNNASVHPGASENCSNGIDDDCDVLIDGADPDCQ
jgi:hypothetical protein